MTALKRNNLTGYDCLLLPFLVLSLALSTQPVLDLLGHFNLCRSWHWPRSVLYHWIGTAERAPVAFPPLFWMYHTDFFHQSGLYNVCYLRWLLPCRLYKGTKHFS